MIVPSKIKIYPHGLAFICECGKGCFLFLLTRPTGPQSDFSFTHTHLLLKNLMEYCLQFLHKCPYFFGRFALWLNVEHCSSRRGCRRLEHPLHDPDGQNRQGSYSEDTRIIYGAEYCHE